MFSFFQTIFAKVTSAVAITITAGWWKILRISVIFALPFILTTILYFAFTVRGNLEIGKENNIENDIKPFISNSLLRQEERLEFLTPIINPKWFLYSVKFRNNKKLAVESDTADPPYSEQETLLTLLINSKEISINYGENKTVSSNIKKEEILDEFSGYGFFLRGNPKQIFRPNSIVNIQDSPTLGVATYKIILSWWSILLIYLFTLLAWNGLILVAKPIFQFIYFGKQWWFKI